jgi:molybdopterin-guanine dinucleotide biosynthesis adapter protein
MTTLQGLKKTSHRDSPHRRHLAISEAGAQCTSAVHNIRTGYAMKVLGFAGWSGSGKTTLIELLIPRLVAAGVSVSLIKHAHHEFDIDQPGKDSYRHRQAGCQEVLVTSSARWALMHELRGAPELSLDGAVDALAPCDLALVEGFKAAAIPKLEIYRKGNQKEWLHPGDPHIIAVVADATAATSLPQFNINDINAITNFIRQFSGV